MASATGIGPNAALPILSLFSGSGGLDLGFRSAGFSSLLAIDFDEAAHLTYWRNHARDGGVLPLRRDLHVTTGRELIRFWKTVSPVQCSPFRLLTLGT
jgi:DNA (cytosine-5)-methyltransferase 1